MPTQTTLSFIAGLLFFAAFVPYTMAIGRTRHLPPGTPGKVEPRKSSWLIWATLDTITLAGMIVEKTVNGQIVGAVGCIGTFLYVLVTGKLSWPKANELWSFALGFLATWVWWIFRSAAGANALVVLAFAVSSWPTFVGVLRDPTNEKPLPWIVWTACFSVVAANALLQSKGPMVLFAPVVLILVHGSVAFLSGERRKERFRRAY